MLWASACWNKLRGVLVAVLLIEHSFIGIPFFPYLEAPRSLQWAWSRVDILSIFFDFIVFLTGLLCPRLDRSRISSCILYIYTVLHFYFYEFLFWSRWDHQLDAPQAMLVSLKRLRVFTEISAPENKRQAAALELVRYWASNLFQVIKVPMLQKSLNLLACSNHSSPLFQPGCQV